MLLVVMRALALRMALIPSPTSFALWLILFDEYTGCASHATRESSFGGLVEVIERHGLFMELYTDRGSHYFVTPEAGGKVSKTQLTQVGGALKQLEE